MLIVGNWKMYGHNGGLEEARALAAALAAAPTEARVALCPPATLISRLAQAVSGGAIEIGGQDSHADSEGACTGSISAEMLAEAGARLVILGHSERRAGHGEDDAVVAAKARGALRAGLEPIICVGETLAQRQGGDAERVVTAQVAQSLPAGLDARPFAVAYEPVWAIGSGLTPGPQEIEAMHAAIRATLRERFGDAGARAPILYGGSVKPANAAEILRLREVGGALVGGASLNARDFEAIIRAA
jgi:triosephosphate isomerase